MKNKTAPVCPWGATFEEAMRDLAGRKCRTHEGQRKQIDAMLDTLQSAGDFWTLEILRRVLARLVVFDDSSFTISAILMDVYNATPEQASCMKKVTSVIRHT